MQEETRNTVYLAISLIIAAITLYSIAYVIHVRSDFANTKYEAIYAQNRAEANRRFSSYNDSELSGAEVVALIRNYYTDGSIDLYIDKDKFGNSFLLDGTTRNLDYKTSVANRNKVCVSFTSTNLDVTNALSKSNGYILAEKVIAAIIKNTDRYKTYLVYDGASVKNIANTRVYGNNSLVTGIYIQRTY